MLLAGKSVIVTGGARGIGACICRVLSSHGASVAVNYNSSRDAAEAVVAEIAEGGGKAIPLQSDVRDPDAAERMVRQADAAFGRVDGLINNAIAGRQVVPFDEATWEDYADMLDFGCRAVVNTIRAVRPIMRNQGGGRIVNIVTELWNMAPAGWTTYLAGKGAMVGMSRSLAMELGNEGITVNMVAPGWMVTEKIDPASDSSKSFAASLPAGYHGTGDEIGKACAFFISELGDYVTGAYLPVTGGRITQMGS